MAVLNLTKSTTIAQLKKEFNETFGAVLRIYSGRSQAEKTTTLGELGLSNEGSFECRSSLAIVRFIERMQNEFGLKVKVYTCDDWVAALDGLTLESAGKVKKNAVKADMENMIAHQRTEKVEVAPEESVKDKKEEKPTAKAKTAEKSKSKVSNQEDAPKNTKENGETKIKSPKQIYEVIIPCEYERVEPFISGKCIRCKDRKYAIANMEGKLLTPIMYDSVFVHNGEVFVSLNGKKGFLDKDGKIIFPSSWEVADNNEFYGFSDGLALVSSGKKYFYMNKAGEKMVPSIPYNYPKDDYLSPYQFSCGLALIKSNGKYSFIDTKGTRVTPWYELAYPFYEGVALVRLKGKYGAINTQGETVLPIVYDWIRFKTGSGQIFKNDFAIVADRDRFGHLINYKIINKWGNRVASLQGSVESSLFGLDNVFARVCIDGKLGIVDKLGNFIIPCKYDNIGIFREGLAYVRLNKKCGCINEAGEIVVPCKYDGLSVVSKQYCIVRLGEKHSVINVDDGKEFNFPFENFISYGYYGERNVEVKSHGAWGLIRFNE